MENTSSPLANLPTDILVEIFPYLDARSFLALCSTCKSFREYTLDATYWRHVTQSTFRVPNQPLVENDGARWQKLYRRMFTQTRVFTWGDTSRGRLGHSHRVPFCAFPAEMRGRDELGVIADMQCGGWSTTFLTSAGTLHTTGVLDGQRTFGSRSAGLHALRFPEAFTFLSESHPAGTTTIRQFSSGRQHILAVSDSGRIWSWYHVHKPALQIKFMNLDLDSTALESSSQSSRRYGRVRNVVAGWNPSSAYVHGVGIVIWECDPWNQAEEIDTLLVTEHIVVPKTSYQRRKGHHKESPEDRALGEEVGAVLNYVMLENYVVFNTDIGKVFFGKMEEKSEVEEILELKEVRHDTKSGTSKFDIQGSFRRFAVFRDDDVITADQDYLDLLWNTHKTGVILNSLQKLQRIPALQNNNVISIAFGDYHFLALHSTGRITSYGKDMQTCGALGLGFNPSVDEAGPENGGYTDPSLSRVAFVANRLVGRLRGLQQQGWDHTAKLLRHAYTHGREVWFNREKVEWLRFLAEGGSDKDEAQERMELFARDSNVQGEVSEWIEQEGRDWDKDLGLEDDDGLGSHFVLSVCAYGWHSGALVLVNNATAEEVRKRCLKKKTKTTSEMQHAEGSRAEAGNSGSTNEQEEYVWSHQSFPRLRLSDGREMPGTVPFDEWKVGRPEWQLDVDV